MLSDLRRSRRGVATIIAEVMMVLIVILLSAIVYVWVVPAFTSQASKDNAGAAYAEKFETVRAQFANNAVSSPETVAACGSQDTSVGCSPGSYLTCNGSSIPSPYTGNVLVRSEEHTSELQSRGHLVCRLLLEKKNILRLV